MVSSTMRLRETLRNLFKVLLVILISIAAFEIVGRFTDYRLLLKRTQYPDYYFQQDELLGADHAPNRPAQQFHMRGPSFDAFTNSYGCFDDDDQVNDEYILAVGDSATWGFVAAPDNWTNRLQQLSGLTVINCGVSGTGARFAAEKAKRVIEVLGRSPAIVILLYVDNDLNDDFVFPSYTVTDGQRIDRVRDIDLQTGKLRRFSIEESIDRYNAWRSNAFSPRDFLKHNSLSAWVAFTLMQKLSRAEGDSNVQILSARYESLFWHLDNDEFPWLEHFIEEHQNNVRELGRIALENQSHFVIFDEGTSAPEIPTQRRRFFEELRQELEFVYTLPRSDMWGPESRKFRHRFDSHWNAAGNLLVAEEMYTRLRNANLID